MTRIGSCSICGEKARIFQCSNMECKKWVCVDCSNEYVAPMIEYFYRIESLPILKCPSCGNNLEKNSSEDIILR